MFSPKTGNTATKGKNTPSVFKPKNGSDMFIQPKLKVGKPGDKYEVEADHVADQVVNKQDHNTQPNISASPISVQTMTEDENIQEKSIAERIQPMRNLSDAPVQRMEEEEVQTMPSEEEDVQLMEDEEVQTMPSEEEDVQLMEDEEVQTMPSEEEDVQLMEDEEVQTMFESDEPVQTMAADDEEVQARETPGSTGLSTSSNISSTIRNTRGQGSPLPNGVQTQMESGFGADFSGVRVHTGSESIGMNQSLGAQAFTNGNDIHFNQDRFNPATNDGQTLLAHELTHTIQQGASGPAAQEGEAASSGSPEASADTAAEPGVAETDAATTEEPEQAAAEGAPAPEEQAASGAAGGQGGGGGGGAAQAEPTTPRSPEDDPNFQQLEQRVENTAEEQQDHEPAAASAGSAQGAAAAPPNERQGGAQAAQVDTMEEQEAGEFSAEAFKAQLMQRIESMQLPANEEEAADFEDNNNIDEVRDAATQDAQAEQATAAGDIAAGTAQEPNAEAIPEREVTPLPPAPVGSAPGSVGAQNAMPPARGEGEVSEPLQDNVSEVDQQMAENEITDEQLANSNEPEFTGALESTNQARDHAAQAPGQFRAQEQNTLQGAQASAEGNSQQSLEGMHGDRAGLLDQVTGQQVQTGTTDTAERQRIAGEINVIYESTKTDVESILSTLDTRVNELFTAGAERAKQAFENHVKREMDAYLDERYGGFSGFLNRVGDVFTGLPDEVNAFFTRGREVFIERMDSVITRIANEVAEKLTEAKDRINRGKQEVQDYVTALPQNLQDIGREAAEGIQEQFDELEQSVNDKQDELIDSLANQYNESLQEVDARIEEMQAANRGLIDMALDAIGGVIKTIIEIKNMLTELLSAALSVITTIIQDPIGFLSMLIQGIGLGLRKFMSNILGHMQEGLIAWLTGSLGSIGITMPSNLFSLSGMFNLVAQILGISWSFVRRVAVRVLGEPVVRVVETAMEVFQVLRKDGIDGLWKYIKEKFTNLKAMVMDAIRDMIISKVVEAGIKWILGLLNPAGAFIKAAMLIIDVVKFFIQRGSQIMEMVKAFTNAMKAVASGNIGAIGSAIEIALKKSIPVLIGFFSSLLGLTGITQKVQAIIQKVRKKIEDAVISILNRIKNAAKRLFRRLMGRGAEDENNAGQDGGDGQIGKNVTFSDGTEGHRLWVQDNGEAELMIASGNPKTVTAKLLEWKNKVTQVATEKDWTATKISDVNGWISEAETINVDTNQQIDTYESEEQRNSASTNENNDTTALNNADNNIERNQDRLKELLKNLFSAFGEENTLTVEVSENDKIRAKYRGDKKFHAVVQQVKDDSEDPNENLVKHRFNWERLTQREQTNVFTDFNTKWERGDIDRAPSGVEHSDYKPQNVDPSIEGDFFVLKYDYGPEGLGRDELVQVEARMKVDDVKNRRINHQVFGRGLAIKPSGSRGRTDSAGRLIRDGANLGGQQLNAAHIIADWYNGSGYREGLNLILTSAHYNQTVMAGAEGRIVEQLTAIQSQDEYRDLLVTFDLQVTAIYEATGDDQVVQVLRGIRSDMDSTALAAMHAELAGDQDPRRCESVTYRVIAVRAGGIPVRRRIPQIRIGKDTGL